MQEKSIKLRVLSAVIGIVLLITMIWSLGMFATADAPQATLVYDNATQKLLELKDDGTYVESANYSATMVGTGYTFENPGYLTSSALSFNGDEETSDAVHTHLRIASKGGDKALGSANGTTIAFWMRVDIAEGGNSVQWEPLLSTGTVAEGDAEGTINVDGVRYFKNGTATSVYQTKPSDSGVYAVSGSAAIFKRAASWCKFTAVITEEEVKVYHNGALYYTFGGSSNMGKQYGTALSPVPQRKNLAAALCNNLAATDGYIDIRDSLYWNQISDNLQFDDLKIYPAALTADQVKAAYDADMDKFVKVTVKPNNGSDATVLSIVGGAVPTLPELTYAGHKFVGWFTDEKLTVPYENTAITANITLYAAWEQTDFTITYHLNGGSLTDPPVTYSPEAVTVLPVPTRAGYEFTGWYRTEDLKGSITKTYLNQIGELELYAGWKAIPYAVTYELGGGINHTANPAFVSVETETVQLQPAIRKGYVFDGWYNGDVPVTELTAGEEAITLTAHWKLRTGDTNKDSNMTVYDAVHLLRVICGLDTLGTDADCDYNKNGSLDLTDVLLLLQYIDGNGVTLE